MLGKIVRQIKIAYSFKIKINIKYVLNNIENILESNKSRHKVNKVLPGNITLNNNAFTA